MKRLVSALIGLVFAVCLGAIDTPILVSPDSGSVSFKSPDTVTFVWRDVSGATKYMWNGIQTEDTTIVRVLSRGPCSWRVRARAEGVDTTSWSDFSDMWTYTVRDTIAEKLLAMQICLSKIATHTRIMKNIVDALWRKTAGDVLGVKYTPANIDSLGKRLYKRARRVSALADSIKEVLKPK